MHPSRLLLRRPAGSPRASVPGDRPERRRAHRMTTRGADPRMALSVQAAGAARAIAAIDTWLERLEEGREALTLVLKGLAGGGGDAPERLELDPRSATFVDRPPEAGDPAVDQEGRCDVAVASDDAEPILVGHDARPVVERE